MKGKRLFYTIRLWMTPSSAKRTEFLKKKEVFGMLGDHCSIMDRKVPLYSKLIRIHNNVHIGSQVSLITHDITHVMLNRKVGEKRYTETMGCIEIMDNVFIGTNTTILPNIRIGENSIIAAGSVVSKDIPPNSVAGGVPAKVICSLDDYLLRREKNQNNVIVHNEGISDDVAIKLWEEFLKERS